MFRYRHTQANVQEHSVRSLGRQTPICSLTVPRVKTRSRTRRLNAPYTEHNAMGYLIAQARGYVLGGAVIIYH